MPAGFALGRSDMAETCWGRCYPHLVNTFSLHSNTSRVLLVPFSRRRSGFFCGAERTPDLPLARIGYFSRIGDRHLIGTAEFRRCVAPVPSRRQRVACSLRTIASKTLNDT